MIIYGIVEHELALDLRKYMPYLTLIGQLWVGYGDESTKNYCILMALYCSELQPTFFRI